jgi:hypothetical protein
VNRMHKHIKFKLQVGAAVDIISGSVNAGTFGGGGSLIQSFERVTDGIVDFGDLVHIQEEIEVCIQHPDGTEELLTGEVKRYPGEILEERFMQGVELIKGKLLDDDLDKVCSKILAATTKKLCSHKCVLDS